MRKQPGRGVRGLHLLESLPAQFFQVVFLESNDWWSYRVIHDQWYGKWHGKWEYPLGISMVNGCYIWFMILITMVDDTKNQWIGLRENLQETMIFFTINYRFFL